AYINKSSVAREDLEIATRDPRFQSVTRDQQARAFQILGIVYTNLKDTEHALESFRASVAAAPDSRFAKDAGERMNTLLSSGLRPDRFPKIPADESPVVAVVSMTYANTAPDQLPAQFSSAAKALENFPGLLAMRRVASLDTPGM